MNLQQQLTKSLTEWGSSIVGFSNIEGKVFDNLAPLKYCISIGVRLSDFIVNEINNKPTFTYFHHYRTLNFLIDQITLKGSLLLLENGYQALPVAASQTVNDVPIPYSGIFPHKTGAVLSGLGTIGKNGLFLSNDYGPRIRLGSILTNMPLEHNNVVLPPDKCNNCDLCKIACPANAIKGNHWDPNKPRENIVDAEACSKYMNSAFKSIGRGSVCGICMKVCPTYNYKE